MARDIQVTQPPNDERTPLLSVTTRPVAVYTRGTDSGVASDNDTDPTLDHDDDECLISIPATPETVHARSPIVIHAPDTDAPPASVLVALYADDPPPYYVEGGADESGRGEGSEVLPSYGELARSRGGLRRFPANVVYKDSWPACSISFSGYDRIHTRHSHHLDDHHHDDDDDDDDDRWGGYVLSIFFGLMIAGATLLALVPFGLPDTPPPPSPAPPRSPPVMDPDTLRTMYYSPVEPTAVVQLRGIKVPSAIQGVGRRRPRRV
ncbi:hypothetical protein DFJ77DRAFT_66697 [Powellomyces hirtus]|nr:hypothetical protein DFJ77DRAFT_66697 [Powellomyces hirtus]